MLCVRLFFVSLSFVLTPFSLCRHKMEVNEEPLTPERRQASELETQFMCTMGQVQGRARTDKWHTLAPSLGMMN